MLPTIVLLLSLLPPEIDPVSLPPGEVLVHLCHDGPSANAWPAPSPKATAEYRERAFGFFAVPHLYVDTGVRGDRPNPFLFRAAAKISLPPGKHRLLLRGRGASRLWIDGKLILSTGFPTGDGSGHGLVSKSLPKLDLGADFRFAPPGNREAVVEFASVGTEHVVILQTIVGSFMGKAKRRPELGETVVAISHATSDSWQLLSPGKVPIAYNDAAWAQYQAERQANLDLMDAAARAKARATHDPYWNRRRLAAKDWLAKTPEVVVPAANHLPAHNEIDRFLNAAFAHTLKQLGEDKKDGVDYFKQVQPILESRCYDCHAGTTVKGGLRLDEKSKAFQGGDADGPSIVPGKPEASSLIARIRSHEKSQRMPPKGDRLTETQIRLLETWIRQGASWPDLRAERRSYTALSDDLTFLRRVTLDVVGVVPTLQEIHQFQRDEPTLRRHNAIERLLADPRRADHEMGYWLDVLAENPNILNPTLNNTGPFRWWIHESLLDNKPADLMVTELVRHKGSVRFGGPAGFAVASQNDAPAAAKAMILASAFLGIEMKCARCHDSPSHRSTQRDLFELAALFQSDTLTLAKSSSVPLDKLSPGGRAPLIRVTLKPGAKIAPRWPFSELVQEKIALELAQHRDDPTDRLAALLTAPQNERFAQVLVNRLWKRLMGRGFVEPVDDWEKGKRTHPQLLSWLARDLVRHGYDLKRTTRIILQSHAYQRANDPNLLETDPLFAAPAPRRLMAEQIVDSLFVATGKPMRLEEVSLDIDGLRDLGNSISLGQPRRSWMLTSTSNERDRPSLALPRIQAVTDVLSAFGWRGARQEPTSVRENSANVLQPAILGNGTMGTWLTRLSDDHGITQLALREQSLETFVDTLFLQMLTRRPSVQERRAYLALLREGWEERRVSNPPEPAKPKRKPEPYVSWSNHLDPEATILRQKQEDHARRGDPPTARLQGAWRERLEDTIWALVNSNEFIFSP
jgi:mono/diheme cytochrome c family protein